MTFLDHFDGKAEVEAYAKTLPIKTAFFAPAGFMQNFGTNQAPRSVSEDGNTWALFNWISPSAPAPLIETAADAGKYITPALLEPDKYDGKFFAAASEFLTYEQIAEKMTASLKGTKYEGKKVVYQQIPKQVMEGFMPSPMGGYIVDMFGWIEGWGYYGPGGEEQVRWTREQVEGAGGKLTGFEEYLEKNPLVLE